MEVISVHLRIAATEGLGVLWTNAEVPVSKSQGILPLCESAGAILNLSQLEVFFITVSLVHIVDSILSFRRQYLSRQYLSDSRQCSNTAAPM